MTDRIAIECGAVYTLADKDLCCDRPSSHASKASREDKTNKPDLSYLMEGMSRAKRDLNKRFIIGAERHGRLNHLSSIGTSEAKAWVDTCKASLSRHYHDYMDGSFYDEDGLTELSGIAWNALDILEYELARLSDSEVDA